MERDRYPARDPAGAALRTEQLYAQLLKLCAGVEELKNGMRACRRQLDALTAAARGAAENEGEENA